MKRIITAAVAVPVALILTIYSPDWLFALLVGLVAALMLSEYFTLAATKGLGRPGSWFLIPAALAAAAFVGGTAWIVTVLTASTLALLSVTVLSRRVECAFETVSVGLSGLLF